MATINLGAIKFNWKGAYNSGTAYAVDDVVSSGGSSYVCILASTGNATSNGTYWEQMSSAGTNGTDVGTTLTTQGDILYRDGSGLQRLAKGTGSQTLKMNSGATAPEWQTVATPTSPFGSALLHMTHETADTVNGGSATPSNWYTRTLNTVKTNEISGASLSGNDITLPSGNYFCLGDSFYTNINMAQTGIYDATGNTFVVMGTNVYAEGYASNASLINGRFTLSQSSTLKLQYYCSNGYSSTGLGFAGSTTGQVNRFANVMIWKL